MPIARWRRATLQPPETCSILTSTWLLAGYDMNIGPLSSNRVGGLMTCTNPHRCPIPYPRSRYHRPPGFGSSSNCSDWPSGLVLPFPKRCRTAANAFPGVVLMSMCCSTSSVRSSNVIAVFSLAFHEAIHHHVIICLLYTSDAADDLL